MLARRVARELCRVCPLREVSLAPSSSLLFHFFTQMRVGEKGTFIAFFGVPACLGMQKERDTHTHTRRFPTTPFGGTTHIACARARV